MDTTNFTEGVFLGDMDLVEAYKSFDFQLKT